MAVFFLLDILCPKISSLASMVQHRHSPEYSLLTYTSERKETQPFSVVHFMNRMNYIHLAPPCSLVSRMSVLLLQDK